MGADKMPQGRVAWSRSSSKSRQGEGVGNYTIDTRGQIAAFGQRFTALVTAGIQEKAPRKTAWRHLSPWPLCSSTARRQLF